MKEYRFKVLKKGDYLCSLSEKEMVIGNRDGMYRIYKIYDFDDKPVFSKECEAVSIYTPQDVSEKVVLVKVREEYRGYNVIELRSGIPVIDERFCVVIKSGIGKIEVYDTETEITITLPAKDDE